jgi:hypothetical protein
MRSSALAKFVSDLWAVIHFVDDDNRIGRKRLRILLVPYISNDVLFATGKFAMNGFEFDEQVFVLDNTYWCAAVKTKTVRVDNGCCGASCDFCFAFCVCAYIRWI